MIESSAEDLALPSEIILFLAMDERAPLVFVRSLRIDVSPVLADVLDCSNDSYCPLIVRLPK